MKRILSLSILLALSLMTFAQEITVRFTGQLNGTAYQQLDSVVVTNTTRGWTETVVYPDTLIVLGSTVNISENEAFVAGLGQNVPNPFDCQTRVELTISQNENVRMQLMDVSGKVYAEFNDNLEAGTHNFEISAAKAQTYILNAVAGNRNYSIRMVNVGTGCSNYIRYEGIGQGLRAKLTTANEFQIGDQMLYVGYTTAENIVVVSEAVSQSQLVSQYVTLQFSHILRPVVETLDATGIQVSSATLNGNIISDGGSDITSRGFYYGTASDNLSQHVASEVGNGEYSANIVNLEGNTTYYYRAYAVNSVGSSVGELKTFSTVYCSELTGVDTQTACDSYTWIDGNTYIESNNTATVTLQNAVGCDSIVTLNLTINYSNTGVDVQTACDSYTWIDGITYTSSNNTATYTLQNAAGCDSIVTLNLTINHSNTGVDVQTACDSYTWIDGNTYTSSNNTATYTLQNAAGCDSIVTLNLTINHSNTGVDVQTACDSYTWIDGITYTSSNNTATYTLQNAAGCDSIVTLNLTINHSNTGVDVQTACDSYTWIDGNTYTSSNNTATYTLQNAVGCDSIVTLNLTINYSNTGVDTQTASESYTWIDGITYTESTDTPTYTFTNAAGCDSVVTLHLTICHCGEGSPVVDYDGNQYSTVLIGEQCWMAENLKTTHFADGTPISPNSSTSTTTAYLYNPNNDSNNVSTYGYLYNWPAAMHGASSSSTNPSNVQGICPNGWHLPSDAEWTQLTDYVSSQSEYQCGVPTTYIAKALASTTGWNSSTTYSCAVGNTPSSNNSTGFGALPAGNYYDGSYYSFGSSAYFWSATEYSSSYAYYRYLSYYDAIVDWNYNDKSYGRSVRCVRDEDAQETSLLPTVTTTNVSSITVTSAVCGGDVISDGGATVTARGVCWSTSQDPTIDDSKTTNGTGIGTFTSILTGLTANTTYYVRAYATNSVGTAYGEQKTFTTQCECGGRYKVIDYDFNQYGTVLIGEQCWMAENLKTTRFPDGTLISPSSSTSTTTAYLYNPNNDSNNVSTYGYLYNWSAAMHGANSSDTNPSNVQGICPNGWHLPSDAEWTQLTDYVSSQSEYQCGGTTINIAKALASTTGWSSYPTTCAVGNTPGSNNSTGFGALPAGTYFGSYNGFGDYAYFWSATESSSSDAYYRRLVYNYAGVYRYYSGKYGGCSVRCVRDEDAQETSLLPTVTTTNVSSITVTSAVCGGDVISDGGATVTARGVCWSTSQDPTIDDSKTTNGTGIGTFTSILTGLTANTTYYVRAYATNSVGTAYGEQKTFTTSACNCGAGVTVTDYDGNQYGTVLIGEQCWMAENLKTTHFPDGTLISPSSSTSTTTAYLYNPNNDSNNVSTYGYLYNWPAAMHGASSSDTNPSNVQGICPNGWHLPSDAEWTQLTDYVSSQSEYQCDGTAENIAKALASTTGWSSYPTTCAVGNTPSSNNSTGFGALPAGYYGGSYDRFGYYAAFWSATESSSSGAYHRYLYYDYADVSRNHNSKYYGRSVRCVRD